MLKGRLPLVIAIVLGLLAGLIAWSAIETKKKEVQEGWTLVPVIVANRDISEGTILDFDMISQRPIPEQFVTASVVKPESANYIVGQKVLVGIQRGDPILWSHFESTKGFEKLSTIIQKKGRAINIQADNVQAVGGWVRPNDHVDILGTFRDPATREMVTVTLLQNVIVLATGKITGSTNMNLVPDGEKRYNTVSVLVLPEEAEILALAGDLGKLTLTLRNPEDLDIQEERGRATIQTLLTGERTKALEKIRISTIQVIRGMSTNKEATGAPAGE